MNWGVPIHGWGYYGFTFTMNWSTSSSFIVFCFFFFAYEHFLSPKLISFTLAWDWNTPLQSRSFFLHGPWGTSLPNAHCSPRHLPSATCCLLPTRNSYSQLISFPWMPYAFNFLINLLWGQYQMHHGSKKKNPVCVYHPRY